MDQVDPISGNPVPAGAAPEEVRDDVDAKLSTGEYVLSADVVRFLGVEKIENLVKKAQDQMKKIEAGVGADTELDEELELPFDPSELQTEDEPVQMATGGLVHGGMVGEKQDDLFGGLFTLPQTATQVPEERSEAKPDDKLTGIAGKVQDWSPKDFDTYSRAISDPGHRAAESLISAIPGGKIGLNARYSYLNEEVPKSINQMLSTGVDLKGNKLTPEQTSSLKSVLDKQTQSGGIKANNSRIAAIADPVAQSLGLDKFTKPITDPVNKAKEAITSPIKQFTNDYIRDPIRGAVQSAIKDPVRNSVESMKQGIRDATSTKKEEKGLITRRDEESNSKDKNKDNDKSDKSGKGEGDKSSSSKGSSKGSSSSGKGSSGKSDKDDKK